jgi:hypothetical protein
MAVSDATQRGGFRIDKILRQDRIAVYKLAGAATTKVVLLVASWPDRTFVACYVRAPPLVKGNTGTGIQKSVQYTRVRISRIREMLSESGLESRWRQLALLMIRNDSGQTHCSK